MRITYVDEAFETPRYRLAAMLLEPEQVNPLSQALHELGGDLEKKHGIRTDELHAYEVFHGEGPWSDVPPRLRIWTFAKVLERVRDAGAQVVLVGLDRRTWKRRAWPPDAHIHLMGVLFERLDALCAGCDDHVVVVADEHDATAKSSRDLVRDMQLRAAREHGQHLRVIDTVHFVRSHESRPVQAADFLAFLFRRDAFNQDQGSDGRSAMAIRRLMAIAEPLVVARDITLDEAARWA